MGNILRSCYFQFSYMLTYPIFRRPHFLGMNKGFHFAPQNTDSNLFNELCDCNKSYCKMGSYQSIFLPELYLALFAWLYQSISFCMLFIPFLNIVWAVSLLIYPSLFFFCRNYISLYSHCSNRSISSCMASPSDNFTGSR